MQADERIVNYMKTRNEQAGTVACVVAVQLFALAAYLCLYALIAGGVFYSLTEKTGKVIIIVTACIIAVILCVINIMTVIRSKKVYITRPDSIALRESSEIVREAYSTARPVLIYKITYSLVMVSLAGIVNIMLLIFMEDQALATIYGRIVSCLAVAFAVIIAYPCIDRISCYRALLNETHELYTDTPANTALMYIMSIAVPASICLWYGLRYYGTRPDIAWIVFPVTALFAFAFAFLRNWAVSSR